VVIEALSFEGVHHQLSLDFCHAWPFVSFSLMAVNEKTNTNSETRPTTRQRL
jgi:hypothetical protein